MPQVNASECPVCGASLQGKNAIRIGEQAFCSKACADAGQKRISHPIEGKQQR